MGDSSTLYTTDSYTLNGGTLLSTREEVGVSTRATFTQTGGNQTVSEVEVGLTAAGTYTVSGGQLDAAGIYVGGNPEGLYTNTSAGEFIVQSKASVTTTGVLKVYDSSSLLSLTGGTLTVGTLTLNANPTSMSWSGGRLVVNGATTANDGSLTVPTNGTLSGTGTINRALTVVGTLAPGDPATTSAGSLTVSSALTLQSAAKFSVRVGDTATTSDELFIGSGLAAATISLANVSLSVTPLANVVLGQNYTIIDASNNPMNNPFVGTFSSLASTSPATYTVNVDEADKLVSITFTSVPEPAAAQLLTAALLPRRRTPLFKRFRSKRF